ncbi:MAG TPA: response regulator, partial [Nitrospira sp.]|nr:response regulator [Nitrospira sp.]
MPKANILIVEDEAVVAADLAGKLERAGYRSVGIACDGEDAVESAKALAPDLVLMDIRLAGPMDGIKTAERIQESRNIPIVYLTAHSDMATLRRAAATEPFGYILKPFEERDVTTQIEIALFKHQAERRLRESEERYRKLIETAMDSIITFDHAGLILSTNAATEHMFGYRTEEMIGRNISMLLPGWFSEEADESPADASARLMRLIGLWREVNGRRRQGDAFPVEIAVSESFSNGEVRYTGILRDISERKRTEGELRWRAGLLAQTHDAVIVWRMGGGIIYWNHGAEQLYGWKVAEVAGRPIHQLLSTTLPLSEEAFHRQLIERGDWQGEIRQLTKDGQTVVVESRMVTMTEDYGGVLVLETNRDVTERQAIHEKVCRLAEELEDRVQERTKELSQSQTLLRQLASELTIAEQRERRRIATDLHDYLAQLLVCARLKVTQSRARMADGEIEGWLGESDDILQQALTYTRSLVAQLTPMALHEFGLAAALKWLADQMRQQYRLSVNVDVQTGLSVALPEDQSVLIFQSIRELLINVAKHARVDQASVRMEQREGRLVIAVIDEGLGSDAAASAPAIRASKFGLFSIGERMRALGGTFEFRSTQGKGTTATLSLPLQGGGVESAAPSGKLQTKVTPRPQPAASYAQVAGQKSAFTADDPLEDKLCIRVLLVDDHALVRNGLSSVLRYHTELRVVGEAADGQEAVAMASALKPDVVIMDVNMPRMDGVEASKRIKRELPSTVVIGLSMHEGGHHESAMRDSGAAAYLTKDSAAER